MSEIRSLEKLSDIDEPVHLDCFQYLKKNKQQLSMTIIKIIFSLLKLQTKQQRSL